MASTTAEAPRSGILQLTSFRLANEEYAIDIATVQEIVRMSAITRVPRSPAFVEGVVNLRGKIVPVIDLRARFGLDAQESTKNTRIIIVQIGDQTVGLIVDQVHEVLRLDSEAISPTPELVANGVDASFFTGVGQLGDRLIIMLDLQRLLTLEEVQALDQVA